MIRQAMRWVERMVQEKMAFEAVMDSPEEKTITYVENDERKILAIPKPKPELGHWMHTLASFTDFLRDMQKDKAGFAKATTVVFLSPNILKAVFDYGAHRHDYIAFKLFVSEERKAMDRLEQGVFQQELWELLTTVLSGCIDGALLLQIAGIRMTKNSEHEVRIDPIGVTTERAGSGVSVVYVGRNGEETANVGLDWTWTGPLWKGIPDVEAEVLLRLSVSVGPNGQLLFKMVPKGLDQIIDEHLITVAEIVRAEQTAPVYLGEYGPQ